MAVGSVWVAEAIAR